LREGWGCGRACFWNGLRHNRRFRGDLFLFFCPPRLTSFAPGEAAGLAAEMELGSGGTGKGSCLIVLVPDEARWALP
jgi:hypothetical protein